MGIQYTSKDRGYISHVGDTHLDSKTKGFKKHWACTGAILSLFGLAFKDKDAKWVNKKSVVHYLKRNCESDELNISDSDKKKIQSNDKLTAAFVKGVLSSAKQCKTPSNPEVIAGDVANFDVIATNDFVHSDLVIENPAPPVLNKNMVLHLEGCSETEVNDRLSNIDHVEDLTLSYVDDHIFEKLKNLHSLTTLTINTHNTYTESDIAHLNELTQLTSVRIRANKHITDEVLRPLKDLNNLTFLNLYYCDNITDEGLKHLITAKHLKELNISGCSITDNGLESLKDLKELTKLELSGCKQVTDKGIAYLNNLHALTDLSLSGCKVTDAGLKELEGLTQLRMLDLSNCHNITDDGLQSLSSLTQLKELYLYQSHKITTKGLVHLKDLENLTLLSLTNSDDGISLLNKLYGKPQEIID